jgi:hypothetical protein
MSDVKLVDEAQGKFLPICFPNEVQKHIKCNLMIFYYFTALPKKNPFISKSNPPRIRPG